MQGSAVDRACIDAVIWIGTHQKLICLFSKEHPVLGRHILDKPGILDRQWQEPHPLRCCHQGIAFIHQTEPWWCAKQKQ